MGTTDVATRAYMSDPARFADVFNYAVYGGSPVIQPGELKPIDSAAITSAVMGDAEDSERRRDGLRLWKAMSDDNAAYALLGMEDQTYVNYAMPVRSMLYDALSYANQVNELKRERRESREFGNAAEFLSGMTVNDRLLPVVTVVMHFGAEVWDGALSLHQMLHFKDEKLLALVPDYRINLVSPASMNDEDFRQFKTGVGLVLGYIKYSKDRAALNQHVSDDTRYRNVDVETARLINALTDSRLVVAEGEEKVDMCKAIDDMRKEAMDQGIEQVLRNLMANTGWPAQRALATLGVPEPDWPRFLERLRGQSIA